MYKCVTYLYFIALSCSAIAIENPAVVGSVDVIKGEFVDDTLDFIHTFIQEHDGDHSNLPILKTDEGQKIEYKLKKFIAKCGADKGKAFYRVTEVRRPSSPAETYSWWCLEKPHLSKKSGSQTREIERYISGEYKIAGHRVQVDDTHPDLKYRIATISAPVEDGKTIPLYSYVYHPDQRYTKVFDALKHQSKYVYDEDLHLREIIRYTGTDFSSYRKYSTEKLVWEADHILGQYLLDMSSTMHHGRSYKYDALGHVVEETFHGNLTGQSPQQIWDDTTPGGERYAKTYQYNNDLLIAEREENGNGALYHYHPESGLLASKFITDHDEVRIRNFYSYDERGTLVKTIVDNGVAEDINDLNGVTERHITYIQTIEKNAQFLPEIVQEMYYDVEGGNEILLTQTQNSWSDEGYLLRKEVWDDQGGSIASQEWSYDTLGRVILEKDAQGNIVERTYDNNGNVLSMVERPSNNEERITIYRYDILGNRIATVDPAGKETTYTYDSFNRLIATEENGLSIKQSYDVSGNIVEATDAAQAITTTTFNAYGKPISIQRPDGKSELFEYSLDGTLTKATASDGTVSNYKHDCFGRLTHEQVFSPTQELISETTYTYDALHLVASTDHTGLTVYYRYDSAGRLLFADSF